RSARKSLLAVCGGSGRGGTGEFLTHACRPVRRRALIFSGRYLQEGETRMSLLPPIGILCSVVLVSTATARQPAPFTEEALQRGINFVTPAGITNSRGLGLSLVDLNNDGYPDLVAIGGTNNIVGLWQNDGHGYFTYRTPGSGVAAFTNASGIVAGDY